MTTHRLRRGLALACLIAATIAPTAAHAALEEVTVYGISKFDGAGQCTGFDSHAAHTASAAYFRAPFDDLIADGKWDHAYTRNDTDAHGSYWTNGSFSCCESYQASCACPAEDTLAGYGVDATDVAFVHTHGGSMLPSELGPGEIPWTTLSMGNLGYDCRVRTISNFQFGNAGGDLEIAVVHACQSMDYQVWQGRGHWEFESSDSTFTMMNAYHGNASCSMSIAADIGDYSESSIWSGVGENWLDEMYIDAWWATKSDDCPVSLVFGDAASDRSKMFHYGGWKDRKSTGTKSHSTYYFINGCHPAGGSALP